MGWWSRLTGPRRAGRGKETGEAGNGGAASGLRGGALDRALAAANRRDVRGPGPRNAPPGTPRIGGHAIVLVGKLPERTRREVALRLQEQRTGLVARDDQLWIGRALARTRCGWQQPEVRRLFALALKDVHRQRPDVFWNGSWPCLELPLAALEELPAEERADFAPYLRTALAAATGCYSPARSPRTGLRPADAHCADRLRTLLALPYDVDRLLPRGEAYATAARCGLGARLYEPGVLELLRLCTLVDGPRPSYAWLGSMREHLARSAPARRALPVLLCAARGRPRGCPYAATHRGGLTGTTGQLLTALAWAACLSGDGETLRELGAALRYRSTPTPPNVPTSLFLRSGAAALAALAGQPGTGRHHRVLADTDPPTAPLAARVLGDVWRRPAGWDPRALSYAVGDYTALVTVQPDGAVALGFRNRHGRDLARVPDDIQIDQPFLLAALRARRDEVRAQVDAYRGALSERLHEDPGARAADWRAGDWQARYLDDPALEPLTRALVWRADTPLGPVTGVPVRRKHAAYWMLRDARGGVHELTDDTPVRLWNPRWADTAEVTAWRSALRRASQPVAQLPPEEE